MRWQRCTDNQQIRILIFSRMNSCGLHHPFTPSWEEELPVTLVYCWVRLNMMQWHQELHSSFRQIQGFIRQESFQHHSNCNMRPSTRRLLDSSKPVLNWRKDSKSSFLHFVLELRVQQTSFLNVTPSQMMPHLLTRWGALDFVDINALMSECDSVWSQLIWSWGRRSMAMAGEVTRHGRAHPYSWLVTIVSLKV